MNRRLYRVFWNAVLSPFYRGARRDPRLTARAALIVGRVAYSLRLYGRRFRKIAPTYAAIGGGSPRRIARRLAEARFRSTVFMRVYRRFGGAAVRPLLQVATEDERLLAEGLSSGKGAIFASWHVGMSMPATYLAIIDRAKELLVLRANEPPDIWKNPGVQYVATHEEEGGEIVAFDRTLRWLRNGGVAYLLVDGGLGADTAVVPCLGKGIVFRRGVAALARMTGVPVYPCAAVWTSGERPIAVRVGPPIVAPEGDRETKERAIAEGLARWFEQLLLAAPEAVDSPESFEPGVDRRPEFAPLLTPASQGSRPRTGPRRNQPA